MEFTDVSRAYRVEDLGVCRAPRLPIHKNRVVG